MALQRDLYNKVKRYNTYRIDYHGINLLALTQIFVFELSLHRLERKGFLNKLKKYSLDNYVKAFISLFSRKGTKLKNSKYLFVNDVYNISMVQNLRAVQKEFDEDIIELIADRRLVSKKSKLIYRYFRPVAFIKQMFGVYGLLQNNSSTLNGLCSDFKIKRRLLAFGLIDSLFVLNCASNFLKCHEHITKIVLNTDVHKLSKALVFLSRERNINTYVIQHGSTVLEYGYLPVIADYMLTWGKLSNDWFIERDTNKEKLIVLGTPKMDGFVNYGKVEAELNQVKTILLILNPIGDKHVRKLLELIKKARLDIDYSLIIKLHPGSVDNKELVEEFFKEAQVEIIKKANIHELIHQSDVIITTTSTVGTETIVFKKPLVQIKISHASVTMDYEKYNCSHLVTNAKELQSILRDKGQLEARKTNYDKFISDYFYRLDGKSAERISKYIKDKQ